MKKKQMANLLRASGMSAFLLLSACQAYPNDLQVGVRGVVIANTLQVPTDAPLQSNWMSVHFSPA